MKNLKPGQEAPFSGQYEIIGSRGGHTGTERTVVKGEPLPPSPSKGMTYRLGFRLHSMVVSRQNRLSSYGYGYL